MRRSDAAGLMLGVAVVLGVGGAPAALAQYGGPSPHWPLPQRAQKPPHLTHEVAPRDPKADEDAPPTTREALRDLHKIRARYFGTIRNVEIRQIGITRMRAFTDPLLYPKMLEIFEKE